MPRLPSPAVSRREFGGLVLASTASVALAPAGPAVAAAGRPIVFYTPHADDETLSMGVLVAAHVAAGRAVHVVLLNDGRDSGAFSLINTRLAAEHRAPLTREQFGAVRVRDFRVACAALGVPAANAHFENLQVSPTVANSTPIIERYARLYPGAGHYTMSWTDPFSPHGYVGQALLLLHRARPSAYPDVRWLVYRPYWRLPQVLAVHPWSALPATAVIRQRVRNALAQYGVWNPAAGRYRTGLYSVRSQFVAATNDVHDLVHGPPA